MTIGSETAVLALWGAYWIVSLFVCAFAVWRSARHAVTAGNRHLYATLSLQLVLFFNLFLNFAAELNWDNPVLSDATRIGGMITTSLMIGAFPLFVNSRDETRLSARIGLFFAVCGLVFCAHYCVSSVYFFAVRFDGSRKYFGGYRYLPAYTVFILQGLGIGYSCLAILAARSESPSARRELAVLRRIVKTAGALFPLVFVIDLVRYFFPILWKPLPSERLLFTPLCFALINAYLLRYVSMAYGPEKPREARPKSSPEGQAAILEGLSRRETEVAALLRQGKSYREIADTLFISLATVQTHVTRIYRKAGVNKKEDLILLRDEADFPERNREKNHINM